MRFIFTFFALLIMVMPQAQAAENRITVSEIYNFVKQTNSAINNPNIDTSRSFLRRTTADNAIIAHNTTLYNYNPAWQRVWYANPAYGAYYRYPVNPYYVRSSNNTMHKWEHINRLENKKNMIPGYFAQMDIIDTAINPYGLSAVVDVDMKEYGLTYTPYNPGLTTRTMTANSKCKMYLSRQGSHEIILSRMDCNTNTNLPY